MKLHWFPFPGTRVSVGYQNLFSPRETDPTRLRLSRIANPFDRPLPGFTFDFFLSREFQDSRANEPPVGLARIRLCGREARSMIPRLFILWLLLAGHAVAGEGELREDIRQARARVYPALVNLTVVSVQYQKGRPVQRVSGGSGVIVSPEGHVLTNYHVAGDAMKISGTLTDGRVRKAEVVGHDPLTDLSVLKLESGPFPFAKLGDPAELEVGDYVLAMGNPEALSSSVTLGVVSNPRRVFGGKLELDAGQTTGLFTRWIQHDALILPGNSGGPLVDLQGQVVGINELGGQGVGFAIPADLADDVLRQILSNGRVRRGWLGLEVVPVDQLGSEEGALVSAVLPGSGAARGGLKPGDLLLAVDDRPVRVRFEEELPTFYQSLAELEIDRRVSLTFRRAGELKTCAVEVSEMTAGPGPETELRAMGVTVRLVDGAVAVTGVRPGKPFGSASPPLEDGDKIRRVDGREITDVASLQAALQGCGPFAVDFRRRRENLVSAVCLEEPAERSRCLELPRPWLGIRTQPVTQELAAVLKLGDTRGFRISSVFPGTPAANAGLREGDVLVAVDGLALRPSSQEETLLEQMIENRTVGEEVELAIGPEKRLLRVKLGPAPAESGPTSRLSELDLEVRDITIWDKDEQGWAPDQEGVLVASVVPGGCAQMAGVQNGDLLLTADQTTLGSVEDLQAYERRVAHTRPERITLFVRREGRTHYLFLEPTWAERSRG
ncbi:MAG: PDZ domain-containing protein [Armatimonadetes bacterium]|nr:PDZ domain-containing protein [Armatimonadota bacterium]